VERGASLNVQDY
jgi:ankyrin repeat protein